MGGRNVSKVKCPVGMYPQLAEGGGGKVSEVKLGFEVVPKVNWLGGMHPNLEEQQMSVAMGRPSKSAPRSFALSGNRRVGPVAIWLEHRSADKDADAGTGSPRRQSALRIISTHFSSSSSH